MVTVVPLTLTVFELLDELVLFSNTPKVPVRLRPDTDNATLALAVPIIPPGRITKAPDPFVTFKSELLPLPKLNARFATPTSTS